MVKILAALLAGLMFGAGLSLGGMTDPSVVLGFLDIFGHWNAQLAFVISGAVITTAIGYRWIFRWPKPLLDATFQLPTVHTLDRRLIGGAALFGIGWGTAGYCPGPVLASLSGGAASLWLFMVAMLAGWLLVARLFPASRAQPVHAVEDNCDASQATPSQVMASARNSLEIARVHLSPSHHKGVGEKV